MKKILILGLMICIMLSSVACTKKDNEDNDKQNIKVENNENKKEEDAKEDYTEYEENVDEEQSVDFDNFQ